MYRLAEWIRWQWLVMPILMLHFLLSLKKCMEQEIDTFRVADMFWEEFYAKHLKQMTLYVKEFDNQSILEFEGIEDLRQFDSEFFT